MNKSQVIFLDTSIQARRTLCDPIELQQIDSVLRVPNVQAVTSAYVWMEYQRSVVADFAHVHRVMCQYNNWGDLFGHILEGPRAFRPRSAVRCTQIIGKFFTLSRQNFEIARYTLVEHIERALRVQFWTDVSLLPDLIVCDLISPSIIQNADRTYEVAASCRKESAACHLPAFLAKQRPKLNGIADYLSAHPRSLKNQAKVEQLIAAILQDPRHALGQTNCWPLGDVIIALQVPAGAALWTLDADFAPLAAALEMPLHQPRLTSDS